MKKSGIRTPQKNPKKKWPRELFLDIFKNVHFSKSPMDFFKKMSVKHNAVVTKNSILVWLHKNF